ncbi:MAG: phosphatidate cytidylyltransferase [Candidatus Eisenbacteria bacterium]|nr:phosphatidate cytidylyltransferase [Candidatus Latescibacterota bacterium]MBD3303482.1 phosphatidate cytidylyltransferase [Candidatus Eisenbacteria bacterium]
MRDLPKRLLTALLLIPPVFLAIRLDVRLVALLLAFVIVLGARELGRLMRVRGLDAPTWLLAVGALWLGGAHAGAVPLDLSTAGVVLAAFALVLHLFRAAGSVLRGTAAVLFASVYLGLMPAHILDLYAVGGRGEEGYWTVFYGLALVWGADTGAYAFGTLLGRHRLWPRVSPSKSWEGVGGGVAVSTIVAVLLGGWVPGLSIPERLAAGGIVGLLSLLGDLVESSMKREASVKDSGRAVPGHGGILDRLDSLILSAPFLSYWLSWSAGSARGIP